jgi:signal peptidase II
MKTSLKMMTLVTVLVLSIGCDQLVKQVARSFLQYSPPLSYFGDVVRLQYAENRGIMLSIGAMLSPDVRFWIFTVGVGLLLMAMLAYVLWSGEMERLQTIAWSLIVSGGFGNLIDRVIRDGVVIDYISIGLGVVRTAVFNLADVLVFAGVFLLLIYRKRKGGIGNAKEPMEIKDQESKIR